MASFSNVFTKTNAVYMVVALIVCYGLFHLITYLSSKGSFGKYGGRESNANNNQDAYKSSQTGGAPAPSNGMGNNEMFASVSGIGTPSQGVPSSCQKNNIQNPGELLPKDNNNQWAQLNPSGKGELSNVNLLKAGYHIGIDTINSTLRNPNLQLRSEPPNPSGNVGPWNNSTITPDLMRPSLELGQGTQ